MFGGSRRNRRASQPLTAATANPAAATAAVSAFARRASSSSLVTAAAAANAALKARPTTPINVAEVETKRTRRRSVSASSHGSQDARKGLQRSHSQGSMTERTFRSRSPSPHRTPVPPAEDAPPVPTIPDNVRTKAGHTTRGRPTSLQLQPFRVASQKQNDGTGSWFGAATEGDLTNVRTSDAPVHDIQPESRNGARHASPWRTESVTSRSTTSDQALVYDANSRRMVPKVELLMREQSVRDASEEAVKRTQMQYRKPVRTGSHLAQGTMGKTHGTAVEAQASASRRPEEPRVHIPTGAPEQKSLASQTAARKAPCPSKPPAQDAPARHSTLISTERDPQEAVSRPHPERFVVQHVRNNDGGTVPPRSDPKQGAPALGRKPSTVREETEEDQLSSDDEYNEPSTRYDVADVLDAVPVRSAAPPKQPSLSSESTAVESPTFLSSDRRLSPPPSQRHFGNVRNGRAHSSSPVRSARFALGIDQLVVRHEPPPRSVSPRKSAMKHSVSPSRGASPTDESSEASGPSRYGSEVTAVEAPVPRKKSVRVSFDEENTKILGLSAEKSEHDSPVPLSPQTARRHWYTHLGRNRKQDIISFDDDELMKPRPALPSFGSVRDKKPREIEERPLVRPIEPPATDAPAHEPSSELGDEPPSPSSDHNTNFGLESMAKNPANISRFREPLPPVVTSVEGSGYFSASITSSEDEHEPEVVQEPEPALPPAQVREEIIAAHPGMADDAAVGVVAAPQVDHRSPQPHEEALPLISIIQPTPTPKETVSSSQSGQAGQGYFDVPGGFPEDDSEGSIPEKRPRHEPQVRLQLVSTSSGAERSVAFATSTQKTTYEPLVEETESEGGSVYSDAYEDLAEMEGDGFMSLDAVITAPVPDKVSQQLYEEVLNVPQESRQSPDTSETSSTVDTISTADFPIDDEWRHAKLYWRSLNIEKRKSLEREAKAVEKAEGELWKTDARQVSSTPDFTPAPSAATDDKWRHAKMYWRSLTIEKRKQLEREAAKEEAGTEGDLEEVARRKKTKRKKLARRNGLGQHSSPESETVHQTKPEPEVVTKEESPHRIKRKSLPERRPSEPSGTVKLQKTMRATTTPQPAASGMGMRKTLRSDPSAGPTETNRAQFGGSWGMRQSLRQNGNSQGVMPRERPLSFQGPPPRHEDEDRRSKRASLDASLMNSTEMAKLMHANLRRRGSDSSETSFRRSRPPRESFGFRTSMRNAPPQPLMAGSTSRFSLQPGSPPGSPSSPPPVSMSNRMTMRAMRSDSSDGSSRRVRLFGKSSGKKPTKPRLKSRFEDSSDEDEAGPSRFASRFDSSDDERAPTATPAVRPVPRTMRTSSSAAAVAMKMPTPQYDEKAVQFPDAQDESSSEEEFPSRRKKPLSARQFSGVSGRLVKTRTDSQGLRRSGSGRGALLESSTAPSMGTQVMSRPSSHRRGSLLSVLRRKKDSDPGKISRAPPSESAARMDTRLERSPEEISGLRLNPPHALDHSMDNWPLIETVDFEKRPRTADPNQHVDSSRPVFAQRRSTNQLLTAGRHGDDETVDGSGKKKKKFKALRRMFKLDD